MRTFLVAVQAATFVALALVLFKQGDWRLGAAQILLAAITALIYL